MKKALYIIGAILLILIITNPSVKAFKEYLGYESEGGLSRRNNFFICSIYLNWNNAHRYLGIAGNFFQINNPPSISDSLTNKRLVDSAKYADSIKMAASDTSVHNK